MGQEVAPTSTRSSDVREGRWCLVEGEFISLGIFGPLPCYPPMRNKDQEISKKVLLALTVDTGLKLMKMLECSEQGTGEWQREIMTIGKDSLRSPRLREELWSNDYDGDINNEYRSQKPIIIGILNCF